MKLKELLSEELDPKKLPYEKNIPYFDLSYHIVSSKPPNLELLKQTIDKKMELNIMIIPDPESKSYYDFQVPFYNSDFNKRLPGLNASIYKNIYNRYKQSNCVGTPYVNCINLPKFFIDFDSVCIFSRRMNSLKDIHKVINCEYLTIENMKIIKSNALGILAIKDIVKLCTYGMDVNTPEWYKIIQKHIETDKDILDCQEELISMNLKDYAKL